MWDPGLPGVPWYDKSLIIPDWGFRDITSLWFKLLGCSKSKIYVLFLISIGWLSGNSEKYICLSYMYIGHNEYDDEYS